LISIVLLITITTLFAFGQKEVNQANVEEATAQYHKIDAKTAKAAFESQSDITIIDVRTVGEFSTGHVIDAINIPLDIVEESVLEQFPNKDEKLYIYCRSGNRSAQAANLLVKQGYTNVYDFGGLNSWPYDIEN